MEYQSPTKVLPIHLQACLIHKWRAESGIELIHLEPTLEELERIWANWQIMPDIAKWLSDRMSISFFGCVNAEHYQQLTDPFDDFSVYP